jgi:DNA-binding NarL/FixJ family response regulator
MKIVIADGRAGVRSALRLLIEQETDCVVEGETDRAIGLFAAIDGLRPDLLLLDCRLPGLSLKQAIAVLRTAYPEMSIIAMSGQPDVQGEALSAGANAFIPKSETPQAVLSILRTIGQQHGQTCDLA